MYRHADWAGPSRLASSWAFLLWTLAVTPAMAQNGLLIVCGQGLGFEQNAYYLEAGNLVAHAYSSSIDAAEDFAIFQLRDPTGVAIIKDQIALAGHTVDIFGFDDLEGFPFTDYRVIILNYDSHIVDEFLTAHTVAIDALEDYVRGQGVLWIQAAFQFTLQDEYTFPLPFGGSQTGWEALLNVIVDPIHPAMAGLISPIGGSHASRSISLDLPAGAHIVTRADSESGAVTLYEFTSLVFSDGFESANCDASASGEAEC